jgi:hypothetical protein
MKPLTKFRQWLNIVWFEHKDEVFEWTNKDPTYQLPEYVEKYKYWLKREYKHQQGTK